MMRSQRLASLCYQQVTTASGEAKVLSGNYAGLCMRFGQLLQVSGLIQTVAFVSAKAASEKGEGAFSHFQRGLAQILRVEPEELNEYVHRASIADYMRYTKELRAAAAWYRRYAESLLKADTRAEFVEDAQ